MYCEIALIDQASDLFNPHFEEVEGRGARKRANVLAPTRPSEHGE